MKAYLNNHKNKLFTYKIRQKIKVIKAGKAQTA